MYVDDIQATRVRECI